jgi:hypothetical protein
MQRQDDVVDRCQEVRRRATKGASSLPLGRRMQRLPILAPAVLVAAALSPAAAQGSTCSVRSTATPPAVVELYTSEGCSSCPPADRWASTLKGRSDVLVLGFHVNYWDRLGWPDRFATAATTERQHLLQRASGARYVYTPQVVLNGRDLRGWSGAALPRLAASPISLGLARDANTVRATIDAAPATRLAGFWAVLEDGHASRVKAGENAGETLAHDHVVTLYKPVAEWSAGSGAQSFALELPAATSKSRRVAFVVTDPSGAPPLQALALGC